MAQVRQELREDPPFPEVTQRLPGRVGALGETHWNSRRTLAPACLPASDTEFGRIGR